MGRNISTLILVKLSQGIICRNAKGRRRFAEVKNGTPLVRPAPAEISVFSRDGWQLPD